MSNKLLFLWLIAICWSFWSKTLLD